MLLAVPSQVLMYHPTYIIYLVRIFTSHLTYTHLREPPQMQQPELFIALASESLGVCLGTYLSMSLPAFNLHVLHIDLEMTEKASDR